jgi:hypothetical protein
MTIEETFNLARQRHFSGQSAEAEVLCNRVLAEQPRNANAIGITQALSFDLLFPLRYTLAEI